MSEWLSMISWYVSESKERIGLSQETIHDNIEKRMKLE